MASFDGVGLPNTGGRDSVLSVLGMGIQWRCAADTRSRFSCNVSILTRCAPSSSRADTSAISFPRNATGRTPRNSRSARRALKASPNDHVAALRSTRSFSKNCPMPPESAGKLPRLGSHPGVENKNESVVSNISTAAALPIADAFGHQGRRAINICLGCEV